jgi:hypothetical protein
MRRTLLIGILGTCVSVPALAEEKLETRFGAVPLIGAGAGFVTSAEPFPGFVGFTRLGVEAYGEVPPWGIFARAEYLSSGADGRWTAPSMALGGMRRVFGDGDKRVGFLVRAGLLYDRWHAATVCPVDLFIPTNCKAYAPPAPTGVITGAVPPVLDTVNAFGALAGARLELPLHSVFVALDGELSGTVDFDQSSPGAFLVTRFALVLGLRDYRGVESEEPGKIERLHRTR